MRSVLIGALLFSMPSFAQERFSGAIQAPVVDGIGNFGSPEPGEIVFDTDTNHFYGFDDTTPPQPIDLTPATTPASTTQSGTVSYEDSGTFSLSFTGPCSPGAKTIEYTRVGRAVTLTFPAIQCNASVSAAFSVAAGSITANLRPTSQINVPCVINDAGAAQSTLGDCQIQADGGMTIYKNGAAAGFSSSGSAGPYGFSITYKSAS